MHIPILLKLHLHLLKLTSGNENTDVRQTDGRHADSQRETIPFHYVWRGIIAFSVFVSKQIALQLWPLAC